MKKNIFKITFILVLIFNGCSSSKNKEYFSYNNDLKIQHNGNIYLFGESHGNEKILIKEFELWSDYYKKGMRDLFVELPYYTAEFLNIWMNEDNDKILEENRADSSGTASDTPYNIEFYKKIKEHCPETIFHGTDVGHQFDTTGYRFLNYLKNNNLDKTEKYELTLEAINQGKYYYTPPKKSLYRENKMVENFIREIKKLKNKDIMGIYGAAHTGLNDLNHTNEIPNMAKQLNSLLISNIISTDLRYIAKEIDPLRIDEIIINNKSYQASYYGKQELNGFKNFNFREFWCIEDSYNDFKNNKRKKDFLPYRNFPMNVELQKIYMIKYVDLEGISTIHYYVSEGKKWKNKLTTEEININ